MNLPSSVCTKTSARRAFVTSVGADPTGRPSRWRSVACFDFAGSEVLPPLLLPIATTVPEASEIVTALAFTATAVTAPTPESWMPSCPLACAAASAAPGSAGNRLASPAAVVLMAAVASMTKARAARAFVFKGLTSPHRQESAALCVVLEPTAPGSQLEQLPGCFLGIGGQVHLPPELRQRLADLALVQLHSLICRRSRSEDHGLASACVQTHEPLAAAAPGYGQQRRDPPS